MGMIDIKIHERELRKIIYICKRYIFKEKNKDIQYLQLWKDCLDSLIDLKEDHPYE